MPGAALVGYTGFVGSTLLRQTSFSEQYRSTDIAGIRGRDLDLLVCAGAPAKKWIANRDPAMDAAQIDDLVSHLAQVRCRRLVLISTVDVFLNPDGVDERSPVHTDNLHPYGANRYRLERFVGENFPGSLIVRLPGLVGPGLRKNVIYDFSHNNNLQAIDSRGVFQFYPMVNLWSDIRVALANNLSLVHLTSEPMSVADLVSDCYGREFHNELASPPARYDFRSCHAGLFGSASPYQYSRREVVLAVRSYAQGASEAEARHA
ncbi:MAG: pyridine nucleotide transhydrogenase [Pseudomonadota bacterium]